LHRLAALQVHRGDFLFQPLHLTGVEVEVAEAAQGSARSFGSVFCSSRKWR